MCIYLQCDPKVVQLLGDLRAELRLAANARPGGQLDPHLPILNPPLLGTCHIMIVYTSHYLCHYKSCIFLQMRTCRMDQATSTHTRCTPATTPWAPTGGGRSWPPPASGTLCQRSYRITVWTTCTIPPAPPPRSADYRQENRRCNLQIWRRTFFCPRLPRSNLRSARNDLCEVATRYKDLRMEYGCARKIGRDEKGEIYINISLFFKLY